MRLKRSIVVAVFLLAAWALPAGAQTSLWPSMAVAGDFNGWSETPNLTNTLDNTWEGLTYVYAASYLRFKYVAGGTWEGSNEWGEIDQTNFALPLLYQFAEFEGYTNLYGYDIVMSNTVSGIYQFGIDDSSGEYWAYVVQLLTESNYAMVGVAGDHNGWSSTPNMEFLGNHTWQAELYISDCLSNRFKFVPHNNWEQAWGETNQSRFLVPFTNTAERAAGYGKDISMTNVTAGLYRFTFNDSNGLYSVIRIATTHASYASMAVAGNFNEWSIEPNMQLVAPYTWQGLFEFSQQEGIWFKFAHNGTWDDHFGEVDQSLLGAPVRGTAEIHNGSGSDIVMQGPLDGRYYFRVNDLLRTYEVMPEGNIQTFDDWTTPATYGTYTNNGWVVEDGRSRPDYSRWGNAAALGYRTNQSYRSSLRTPFMASGIKWFSFWYRPWAANSALWYDIQTSSNGTTWTTIDTLTNLVDLTYTNYFRVLNATNGLYVRLLHIRGVERVLFDDFVITEPFADMVFSDVTTSPQYPWSNETVNVSGYIITNGLATGASARCYWRAGTSGTFSVIGMSGTTNYYTTTNAIPAQPRGTKVYYYLEALFGGPGGRSPKYWPSGGSGNPAWYGIARNKHGHVWINEICAFNTFWDSDTNEFVELCGVAQADIGNWEIELYDGVQVLYGTYSVPDNTLLPNDSSGFGFYVLGDAGLSNVNQVFTHTPEGSSHLKDLGGGIKLINELGATEFALSYGESDPGLYGFTFTTNYLQDLITQVLLLGGTGSNAFSFAWTTNELATPGAINVGQTLTGGNPDPPPVLTNVTFTYVWAGTNVILRATGTNGWNAVPYYTTRLTNQFPNWTPIASYNSEYNGNGISTITFDLPAGVTCVYFRVKSESSW